MNARPNQNTPEYDFTTAYARILNATGARTQTELAALLGIQQSSISDAKRRNALPDCWLLKLYRAHRLNPDWVLTGEGHKYLAPAGDTPEVQVVVKGLEEFTPSELLNELKRRFPGFTLNLTMTGGEHSPLAEEAAAQASPNGTDGKPKNERRIAEAERNRGCPANS